MNYYGGLPCGFGTVVIFRKRDEQRNQTTFSIFFAKKIFILVIVMIKRWGSYFTWHFCQINFNWSWNSIFSFQRQNLQKNIHNFYLDCRALPHNLVLKNMHILHFQKKHTLHYCQDDDFNLIFYDCHFKNEHSCRV